MNKELKFRAYNKDKNKMSIFYIGSLDDGGFEANEHGDLWYIDDCDIMQFTGLVSSDGGCHFPVQDAYFGDIVEFYNTDGNRSVAEIIWDDKLHCISFKRTDGFLLNYEKISNSGYFQPSNIQFQIIGNIYQNSELLNDN